MCVVDGKPFAMTSFVANGETFAMTSFVADEKLFAMASLCVWQMGNLSP